MNENHQSHLDELKAEMDGEFGITAIWKDKDGTETPVAGVFSTTEKTVTAKSKVKKPGQLDINYAQAFFSMSPSSVPGEDGDQLIVDQVIYHVLKFHPGTFQTVIPLKLSENKNHNWSGYVAT